MSERRLSLMQLQASLGTMERWSPPQSSQGTFGEYTSPEDGQLSTHAACSLTTLFLAAKQNESPRMQPCVSCQCSKLEPAVLKITTWKN